MDSQADSVSGLYGDFHNPSLIHYEPERLAVNEGDAKYLPITHIVIGRGQRQRRKVSKINVGDLLLKFGYQNVVVELSSIPYRLP